MIVIARRRAHSITDIIQTVAFSKLTKEHRYKVRPCVISFAVLVGLELLHQRIERISGNFLEDLRKKSDLHPEVGLCFCETTQTYRIRPEPTSFFFPQYENVLDRCD